MSDAAVSAPVPWQRRLRRRYKANKRFMVYALARAVASFFGLLPTSWVLALGGFAGRLAAIVSPGLREVACRQLQLRLDMSPELAAQTAREVFTNVGRVAAEITIMPRLQRDIARRVQLSEADSLLLDAAAAEGKGVLLVSAHLGNWELLAQRLAATEHEAFSLARKSPNPYIGRWLQARRQAGGLSTLNRGGSDAIRGMLSALKRGGLIGVLIDQDTKVESVHVPFFGQPAATPVAVAKLALRRRIPVMTVFIERTAQGHRLSMARVELPESGTRHEQALALTASLTARIEAAVRERPSDWVWFHERWKTSA